MTMIKTIAAAPGEECQHVEMTADEEAARQAEIDAWEAGQPRRDILSQIAALETTQTDRRIREALAGTDNGWMAALNTQIAALRAQLT
jgi:hypothetical protein